MPHNVRPRDDLPVEEKKFVADLIRQMHNAGGFCTVRKGLELCHISRFAEPDLTMPMFLAKDCSWGIFLRFWTGSDRVKRIGEMIKRLKPGDKLPNAPETVYRLDATVYREPTLLFLTSRKNNELYMNLIDEYNRRFMNEKTALRKMPWLQQDIEMQEMLKRIDGLDGWTRLDGSKLKDVKIHLKAPEIMLMSPIDFLSTKTPELIPFEEIERIGTDMVLELAGNPGEYKREYNTFIPVYPVDPVKPIKYSY